MVQADGSNIPVVVSSNFSYSFLPTEVRANTPTAENLHRPIPHALLAH